MGDVPGHGGGSVATARDLPIACTLTPSDVPGRLRRWQRLHERAAPSAELSAGRLEIRYRAADGVLDELRALVDAERSCCAFVTWDVTDTDGRPTVRVSAPAGRPEAVLGVAAMFGVDEQPRQAPPAR